jgi:hypothetical protein
VIAGEENSVPVTLADLLLAVLIVIVTVVASRRFPALLEIIMLQRFSVSSGGRYAATALSRYSIAAIGTLLAFSIALHHCSDRHPACLQHHWRQLGEGPVAGGCPDRGYRLRIAGDRGQLYQRHYHSV